MTFILFGINVYGSWRYSWVMPLQTLRAIFFCSISISFLFFHLALISQWIILAHCNLWHLKALFLKFSVDTNLFKFAPEGAEHLCTQTTWQIRCEFMHPFFPIVYIYITFSFNCHFRKCSPGRLGFAAMESSVSLVFNDCETWGRNPVFQFSLGPFWGSWGNLGAEWDLRRNW